MIEHADTCLDAGDIAGARRICEDLIVANATCFPAYYLLGTVARQEGNREQAMGGDAQRLVFAGPLDLPDHLARHRLGDLFLDTLPYNAHTTTSDALWRGFLS